MQSIRSAQAESHGRPRAYGRGDSDAGLGLKRRRPLTDEIGDVKGRAGAGSTTITWASIRKEPEVSAGHRAPGSCTAGPGCHEAHGVEQGCHNPLQLPLTGGSFYGAIAQSQIQTDVLSGLPDRLHHTLDLHPLPVLSAGLHLGEGDPGRGRRQRGLPKQARLAGTDDGSITPCGTYARNFKQIAGFERNRRAQMRAQH